MIKHYNLTPMKGFVCNTVHSFILYPHSAVARAEITPLLTPSVTNHAVPRPGSRKHRVSTGGCVSAHYPNNATITSINGAPIWEGDDLIRKARLESGAHFCLLPARGR